MGRKSTADLIRAELSKRASAAAKARWKDRTPEERSEHARKMAQARITQHGQQRHTALPPDSA